MSPESIGCVKAHFSRAILFLAGALLANCLTLRAQIPGGYSLDLDGVNAHVQINSNASLALGNRLTLEVLIYPTEAKCETIISRGDGGFISDYLLNVGY